MTSLRYRLAAAAAALLFTAAVLPAQFPAPLDLLPDASLQGWTRIPIPSVTGVNPKIQWRVDPARKTLVCTGDGGHEWLRYDRELGDFILSVDWRFTPRTTGETRYNSGIGIRLSKLGEIWYQAQTGPTGGYIFGANLVEGAIKSFNLSKTMKENRVKPAGEWNHYEIRAEGPRITLAVNGATVSEVENAGLLHGYIGLEAEGYEITFKNLTLQPLGGALP
jgi:hypothetical protein